jgi:hypothetical protein
MGKKIPNDCRPPRPPRRIASRNGELIENPDSWRKIRETAAILYRENVGVLPGRVGIREERCSAALTLPLRLDEARRPLDRCDRPFPGTIMAIPSGGRPDSFE